MLSVSEDEEDAEAGDVYQSDEGEDDGPRQGDLDQVTRERHQNQTCSTQSRQNSETNIHGQHLEEFRFKYTPIKAPIMFINPEAQRGKKSSKKFYLLYSFNFK